MVQESKYGQTTPNTRVNGERTKPMVEESSGMLMVTSTTENGKTTKPMGMVFTSMSTVLSMRATGRMISKTVKAEIEEFMPVIDMQAGDEHDLTYHRVYQEYLSEFEGKIARFIAEAGATVEEFHEISERVLELDADSDDFDPARRFFIEALLATTEYDIFMGLMKEEAKKHRALGSSSQRK